MGKRRGKRDTENLWKINLEKETLCDQAEFKDRNKYNQVSEFKYQIEADTKLEFGSFYAKRTKFSWTTGLLN